jgi:hypothetical protein
MAQAESGLLEIYESINGDINDATLSQYLLDHPEFDVEKINDQFTKKYPMLEYINTYHYNQIAPHVAEYINLIDKNGETNV